MSLFSNPVEGLLNAGANLAKEVFKGVDDIVTSDEEKQTLRLRLMELMQKPHMLQASITLAEAQSKNIFKSGWRPALGWLCVSGLGLHFLVFPILGAFGINTPELDAGQLMSLVLALLGLGGMRSYEKKQGLTP